MAKSGQPIPMKTCTVCKGRTVDSDGRTCPICGGTGQVIDPQR